ncbi:hypothetical protein BBJ29_010038, partial [Phytophthora kernoviae]
SMFSNAGISDSRMDTLVIDFLNIWPAFFTGVFANCFGSRNMIMCGLAGMVAVCISMADVFVLGVSALSIVFAALYIIVFGVAYCPMV